MQTTISIHYIMSIKYSIQINVYLRKWIHHFVDISYTKRSLIIQVIHNDAIYELCDIF